MIDGKEINALALSDFGTIAAVNGSPLQVIPCLEGGFSRADGDLVNRIGPYVLAESAAVAALDLDIGSDELTLDEVDYTILSVDPDTGGMVMISLEVAA